MITKIRVGRSFLRLITLAGFLVAPPHQLCQRVPQLVTEAASTLTITSPIVTQAQQVPANCEDALLYLDEAVTKARDSEESYLIVIASLGNGERSNQLNKMRLRTVQAYLTVKGARRIVTAERARVKGLGQIEIYVGGKLLRVLRLPKNERTFCNKPLG